jgi:hypothetical protein
MVDTGERNMINRIILALIVTVAPLCAVQAEQVYGDWRTDGPCNFLPAPKTEFLVGFGTDSRPEEHQLLFDPVVDFRVHLKNGTPHIELWKGDEDFLHKMVQLHAGTLTIAIDGHVFKKLHPNWAAYGGIASDELPIEIFSAMHDGQTIRIEYQEQGAEEPLVREQSLKGFGAMVDACRATPPPPPLAEVATAPLPKEPPDLVLKCKMNLLDTPDLIRIWNSGVVAENEKVVRATVGYSEIVYPIPTLILRQEDGLSPRMMATINRADGIMTYQMQYFSQDGKEQLSPHGPATRARVGQCEKADRRF